MSVNWKSYVLPERVSFEPDCGLIAFLQAHRAEPVRLDARAVERVDSLLVQYLIAAAQAWARRGLGFEVADVGAGLGAGLARLGVTADHLAIQEKGA